jgi:hypothetical protein
MSTELFRYRKRSFNHQSFGVTVVTAPQFSYSLLSLAVPPTLARSLIKPTRSNTRSQQALVVDRVALTEAISHSSCTGQQQHPPMQR